jgi:hypothetical protein
MTEKTKEPLSLLVTYLSLEQTQYCALAISMANRIVIQANQAKFSTKIFFGR